MSGNEEEGGDSGNVFSPAFKQGGLEIPSSEAVNEVAVDVSKTLNEVPAAGDTIQVPEWDPNAQPDTGPELVRPPEKAPAPLYDPNVDESRRPIKITTIDPQPGLQPRLTKPSENGPKMGSMIGQDEEF